MKMIDHCGCDNWAIAMAKDIFETNHIPCEEASIVDMDDKWITITAEVRDNDSAEEETAWEEKRYVIKY